MTNLILNTSLALGLLLSTSFDTFKPREADLIGLWKVDHFVKGERSLDIANLDISIQCSVEGEIGKFSGRTKKNFFSGLYKIKSKKAIELSSIMSTKYDESEVSKEFIETFQSASEFKLENDRLLLINDKDGSTITFKKK